MVSLNLKKQYEKNDNSHWTRTQLNFFLFLYSISWMLVCLHPTASWRNFKKFTFRTTTKQFDRGTALLLHMLVIKQSSGIFKGFFATVFGESRNAAVKQL